MFLALKITLIPTAKVGTEDKILVVSLFGSSLRYKGIRKDGADVKGGEFGCSTRHRNGRGIFHLGEDSTRFIG
jgi:hypothetical protein